MLNTKKSWYAAIVGGVLLWGTVSVRAESPSLTTLEGLVEQWVSLRGQAVAEKQTWDRQAEQWRQEITLLREEERRLDAQLEHTTRFEAAEESRTASQLSRKMALREALTKVDAVVDRAATPFSQLLPLIPPSLQSADIKRATRELLDPARSDTSARRVQLLVGVLSEIEALQNRNHVLRELVDPGTGQRREMDVVYFGLARGYAISPDDAAVATGIPTQTGWRWSELDPSTAGAIRTLVRILNEEQPPAVVSVPMVGDLPEVQP
jgi:hypothetical protein